MNSLGLVYHWFCRAIEGSMNISDVKFVHSNLEKRNCLSSSNFQFGNNKMACKFGCHERGKSSTVICKRTLAPCIIYMQYP